MKLNSKILVPLIIVLFALGLVIGYVIPKPPTIEEPRAMPTPAPIPEPTLIPTPIPTPMETPVVTPVPTPLPETPVPTPSISNFTVKGYNPDIDNPTATIEFVNKVARPVTASVRPGETVLFIIKDYTIQSPLTLVLDTTERDLGTTGAAVVTFNLKGTYSYKAIFRSNDPYILPRTYAEGSVYVYSI